MIIFKVLCFTTILKRYNSVGLGTPRGERVYGMYLSAKPKITSGGVEECCTRDTLILSRDPKRTLHRANKSLLQQPYTRTFESAPCKNKIT